MAGVRAGRGPFRRCLSRVDLARSAGRPSAGADGLGQGLRVGDNDWPARCAGGIWACL
jgi:hypothetical protein